MGKLFGTDGIRGVANEFPMTPEVMVKIGRILGTLVPDTGQGVVIGRDSRLSGEMLECALTAGLVASGTNVKLAGIIPTPAVAFLTQTLGAQAGIVISASHNPARDNGVKFFSADGYKLADELEEQIEDGVLGEYSVQPRPIGSELGRIEHLVNPGQQYVEHALQMVFPDGVPNLEDMNIVVDYANGAASVTGPLAFKRLGARVTALSHAPDGLNINVNCGAVHTETLQQRVQDEQADVGIAFDGDADRLILVNEKGEQVDGDRILAIFALELANRRQLKQNILVATVMSNLGLEIAMKNAGITLVRSAVGDRHVVKKMREIGANVGGEQSGHLILADYGTTGDGLMSALTMLKILYESGKTLSEQAACMTHFPQSTVNVHIKERKPLEEMSHVMKAIKEAEAELGERGRVLVRYSGTELLARVMVEAEDDQTVERIAETIAEEIRKENS